jgi:phosphohistidine phosphatase
MEALMRRLTLLRHAKSVQDPAYAVDRERPLAERGRLDAEAMGRFFSQAEVVPGLIVSSPAVRARQTAEILARAAGGVAGIRWEEAVYAAGADALLSVVRGLPDTAEHALLVGHNPGFEELAALLIGTECGVTLPTAAAAHFEIDADRWSEVCAGAGRLQWLIIPKLLKKKGG